MKITLLGTGCPIVSTERFGPATLVSTASAHVLIDCGSGVTQRLLAAGVPGRDIDAVLLTHLHSDHIVDLFQLVLSSWHQGRAKSLPVYGPVGTRTWIDRLFALWRPEIEQRVAHEKRPTTAALEVVVTEFDDSWCQAIGDVTFRAIRVDHRPVREAFGFHAADARHRAVFSGDTRPCDSLVAAARDVDLLIHEVFVHRELPVTDGVRSAETVANVGRYHTASTEVGEIARSADVRALALTHIVPPWADRETLRAEVCASFGGSVTVGEDLMEFDLDARTLSLAGAMRPF